VPILRQLGSEIALWRAGVGATVRRLGRERHVAAGGARLRRDEGVEAVLAPDAIDAPANAEDARLEIEALRSPGKREQLAQAGPGAECQDEQRRGEATASTGVLRLG
jgi:hypothetical protein